MSFYKTYNIDQKGEKLFAIMAHASSDIFVIFTKVIYSYHYSAYLLRTWADVRQIFTSLSFLQLKKYIAVVPSVPKLLFVKYLTLG